MFVDTSKAKFRFSFYIYQNPLRGNGHWFPFLYIKTLCDAMVIDLFTSRPSVRPWSSISLYQDPLQSNGHWFLMSHRDPLRDNGHRSFYIKTLFKAMVIDFLCHIEALCEAMVIDLFTSRPSARQWSLISYFSSYPINTYFLLRSSSLVLCWAGTWP